MSRWPDPDDVAVRLEHLYDCIGCHLINKTRLPNERWILCFEYADRSGFAVKQLIDLYDTNEMRNLPNRGLPTSTITGAVTLQALVEDICSRFKKGSLITGEARVND